MKLRMLPVLLLGIAVSANVSARPQDGGERAEVGPRFGLGQTRQHEAHPSAPQSGPQQVPRQPQLRQMPQAPQFNRNAGQSRNQTPHWQVDHSRGDNADRHDDRDNGPHWSGNRGPGDRGRDHYQRNRYDGFRANNYRYNSGRYYARQRFSVGNYFLPRGYSTRVWYVGDWLPYDYYDDVRYHLDNPASYNLYDPPIGCHWVRVGADALLIDYYSGEILEVVYSLFW